MDTKGVFSGALMRLLETRCIDDITVGDIVEESGLGRSTFYKHFADKYELARWTHVSNQRPIMNSYFEEGGSFRSTLIRNIENYAVNAGFYRNASGSEYYSLRTAVYEVGRSFFAGRLKTCGLDVDRPDIALLVRMVSRMHVDAMFEWVEGGCQMSAEELADVCMRSMPPEFASILFTAEAP